MRLPKILLGFGMLLGMFLAAGVLAQDLYLEQPVASGVYSTGSNIIARNDCRIEPNQNVIFLAGKEILLKAGFHAAEGTIFRAKIGDYSDIPENLDTDNDKLPDWWEVRYFTTTLSSDSGNDADGDGVMDSVEFRLNSNPAVNDLPGPGLHYEYDALGRIKRIYRIPTR